MKAIQVYRQDFDIMENRIDSAITNTYLGTFTEEGTKSAHGMAAEFISGLKFMRPYLAWDGKVYPIFYTANIEINGSSEKTTGVDNNS